MKTTKQIIWDWNGTLWDDAVLCVNINNNMLKRRGLPAINLAIYQQHLEFPVSNYYTQIGFDYSNDPYEQLAHEFIHEYETRRLESPLRDQALETLALIQQHGISQSVLSAYQQNTLENAIAHFQLTPFFSAVIGLNDVYAEGKVANGIRYMKQLNMAPETLLFIGDTVHDYEVAQAMGIPCLLIAGGHNSRERLEQCGVPVIDSLTDIMSYL
jgi:phosphoglycolate phosphatase